MNCLAGFIRDVHRHVSTAIDDVLGERRLELRWAYETQHTAVALNFVREGLGLTVVPALSVDLDDGLVTRPLLQPSITRRLAIMTRRGAVLSELAATLRDLLVAALCAGLPRGKCVRSDAYASIAHQQRRICGCTAATT
jgi:DNA-binding transcriptional LysR family regulator